MSCLRKCVAGVMVSIGAFQALDPSSILGRRKFFFNNYVCFFIFLSSNLSDVSTFKLRNTERRRRIQDGWLESNQSIPVWRETKSKKTQFKQNRFNKIRLVQRGQSSNVNRTTFGRNSNSWRRFVDRRVYAYDDQRVWVVWVAAFWTKTWRSRERFPDRFFGVYFWWMIVQDCIHWEEKQECEWKR